MCDDVVTTSVSYPLCFSVLSPLSDCVRWVCGCEACPSPHNPKPEVDFNPQIRF